LDYRIVCNPFCLCGQFVGRGATFQNCEAKTIVTALVCGSVEMVDVSAAKKRTGGGNCAALMKFAAGAAGLSELDRPERAAKQ
jgi:hypothetical protein